jgi:hypothetical protein
MVLREFVNGFRRAISNVPQLSGMTVAVSLSPLAIPLVSGPVFLNGSGLPIGFHAPTIIIGLGKVGRLLFVGHFSIVSGRWRTEAEGAMFLELISRYLCGEGRRIYRAVICGWPIVSEAFTASLAAVDVIAEYTNDPPTTGKCHLGIATTDYGDVSGLENFLSADGGLVVCGVGKPVSRAMRVLLEKYGIGIPQCPITAGDPDRKLVGRIVSDEKQTFCEYIKKFVRKAENPSKHIGPKIDKVTAALRLHILALTGRFCDELQVLASAAWAMLEATGGCYVPGRQTVCPTVVHNVVAVLIADIVPRLQPSCFRGMDRSLPFPGLCDLEPATYAIRIDFPDDCWVSTGLYLIPGVLATVECTCRLPNCWVQAGAHTWSGFQRQGPWRRFPAVTVRVPLDSLTFELCSPFGGIVYVGCDDRAPSFGFDITFHGVGRHPMYSSVEDDAMSDTHFLSAPWGEIETEFVIFTVPVSVFSSSIDLRCACEVLNGMLRTLLSFLADESASPFRVVFDVEIAHPSTAPDYPLFMPVEAAEAVLGAAAPCDALVQMLHRIAKLSLPPSELPSEVREALVVLAVYAAAVTAWPNREEEILLMIHTSSPLWMPLLRIYSAFAKDVFPNAMMQIRPRLAPGAAGAMPLDRQFVKALSKLCDKDFSKQFYGPGGLLAIRRRATEHAPSEGLADYTLDPDDVSANPL